MGDEALTSADPLQPIVGSSSMLSWLQLCPLNTRRVSTSSSSSSSQRSLQLFETMLSLLPKTVDMAVTGFEAVTGKDPDNGLKTARGGLRGSGARKCMDLTDALRAESSTDASEGVCIGVEYHEFKSLSATAHESSWYISVSRIAES